MSSKQPYGNDPLRMSREWRSIEVPEVFPKHPLHNDTAFGIAQDASLKTLNATKYPSASALSATANVKRYVFVGTQNGPCQAVETKSEFCIELNCYVC